MVKRVLLVLLALVVLLAGWFVVSPVPGALLIRWLFEADGAKTRKALEKHTAPGIAVERGIVYSSTEDDDARLDVYRREDAEGPQPTLVWVHGGAWLSGHRDDAAPYFTRIADAGFTVASIGYSRAPGARYPTPVRQVNEALAFLSEQADRFGIDPERFALAGDSAGAQIASQVAAMISDPGFAAEVGVEPGLGPEALRAIVLYCGIYDIPRFLDVGDLPSLPLRWGIRETIRAYTGTRDPGSVAAGQMSSIDHLTERYPAAFISGGNGDALTDTQSRPLAEALRERGVAVETLFFPADRSPVLPHEYQFNLDDEAGAEALRRMLGFLERQLATSGRSAATP